MKITKYLGIALVTIFILNSAGCAKPAIPTAAPSAAPTEAPAAGGTSEQATEVTETRYIAPSVSISNADPVSLMPLRGTGNGKNVLNEIYETLVDRKGFGIEFYSVIAKDWSWVGDDLVMNLYDYVYDHAGNHLTAADVVFSFVTPQENGFTNNRLQLFTTYDPAVPNSGVEATGDYQVTFHFKSGMGGRDVLMGWLDMICSQPIFTKAAWEASTDGMAANAVGTGRYKVKEVVTGATYVLERWDDYWQTDESLIGPQHLANVQEITYKIITDPQQVVNALKAGDIDYANHIQAEAVPQFKSDADFNVISELDNNVFMLLPNCLEGSPLHDANVRAAIFYALDVDDIIAAIGGPDAATKLYQFGIQKAGMYNPAWETWDNYYTKQGAQLDKAKQFLANSDYNGQVVTIWYETGTYGALLETVSLVVGRALETLGIKYEIKTKESQISEIYAKPNLDWGIVLMNIGGNGHILDYGKQNFNTNFYAGGAGGYNDPELDVQFSKTFSESGAYLQQNIDDLMKLLTSKFYVYGLFQITVYDIARANLLADTSIKTFRTWIIPGSFTFVQP